MKKEKSSVPSSLPGSNRDSTQASTPDEKANTTPSKLLRALQEPATRHRELGRAILAACDPVEVGRKLLESKSESVKARALEMIAGWAYGTAKPNAGSEECPGVHIIWDLPAPRREKRASPAVSEDPSEN
jgi:hypothetical protein